MNGPELIRQYILAHNGVDIEGIAEPRNEREWQLYNRAYMVALLWWTSKHTS